MPNFTRKFIVEDGRYVSISDQEGRLVTFESFEDFERCTEMSLSGKWYIGYEPYIELYADSEEPEVSFDSHYPNEEYEALIDNIVTLKERKENPLYGLSGQDLIDMQNELQRLQDIEDRLALLEAEQSSEGIHVYTPDQIRNYIDNQIDGASTSGEKLEVIKSILKKMAIYILK